MSEQKKYYKIVFQGVTLDGLNDILGKAKTKVRGAKFGRGRKRYTITMYDAYKKKTETTLGLIARPQIKGMLSGQYSVVITWYEPNNKRDIDNIQAGQKFIWDALQAVDIISNDNKKTLGLGAAHIFKKDKENPRIEVELLSLDLQAVIRNQVDKFKNSIK